MKILIALLTISGLALVASCAKQEQSQTPDSTHATAAVKSGQGLAVVRAIDASGKSITLDHGTVPGVMDAMTMEYPVSDPSMVKSVAVGDSVTFTLEDRGDGNYIVTNIIVKKKG